MKTTVGGLKRIWKAFGYSLNGFKAAFTNEVAFRQDIVFFVIGTAAAFYFPFTWSQRSILIFSLLIILLAELTNTAMEYIIDRISPDYHELSGKAKDIGSCLVFLSFTGAVIVWTLICYERFLG